MLYKIGIDVGGTFTDFLLTRSDGRSQTCKVLSTPKDPSIGTMKRIAEMAGDEGPTLKEFLTKVDVIAHVTTDRISGATLRLRALLGLFGNPHHM